MNYKRKRPKSARAGCLMCKPWKHQRKSGSVKAERIAVQRAKQDAE